MALMIKSGDTLGNIASRYGTTVEEIMRLNPTLTDPNKIQAGASLAVPTRTLDAPPSKNLDAVPEKTLPPSHTGKLVSFIQTLQQTDELAQAKRLEFANQFAGSSTFKPGALGATGFVDILLALSGASASQDKNRNQIISAFSQDVNEINDVAKIAASFDAPESVINKILSSKSVGEASINARGYLRAREKGSDTRIITEEITNKNIPTLDEYIQTAEKIAQQSLSLEARKELGERYKENFGNKTTQKVRTNVKYTDAQLLKLEAKGLLKAPREEQLSALFSGNDLYDEL